MKVFIDTGAFCALTIPKDQYNLTAKTLYKQIQKDKAILYTSAFDEHFRYHPYSHPVKVLG